MEEYEKLFLLDSKPKRPVQGTSSDESQASAFEENLAKIKERKKKDPEQKAIDYFIQDPAEQTSIKMKAAETITDIVDVLDNLNRVGYAVAGGLKSSIKNLKEKFTDEWATRYDDKPFGEAFVGRLKDEVKDTTETLTSAWKGLTREEKFDARDVMRELTPEFLDKQEKLTKFSVMGIDADALSAPLFGTTILMDPLTYIPFGAPIQAAKGVLKGTAKGLKAISAKVIGEAAVKGITSKVDDILVSKIYPHINIKGIFKKAKAADGSVKDVSDLAETMMRSKEIAEGATLNSYKKVFSEGDMTGFIWKSQSMMDEAGAKELNTLMGQLSDIGETKWMDFKAKELGVAVDDMVKFNEIEGVIGKLAKAETKAEEDILVGALNESLKGVQRSTAVAVKTRILEERGLKRVAGKIALQERDATIEVAKNRLLVARQLRSEAQTKVKSEIASIHKSLKSGIKITGEMLSKDVEDAVGSVRGLYTTLSKVTKEGLEETPVAIKSSLDLIKGKIASLTKYQVDVTKGVQGFRQSDIPLKKINALVRNLEVDIGKEQIGVVGTIGKKLQAQVKSTVATINKELKAFKKASVGELSSIKGNVKASRELQSEIVKSSQARLDELFKTQTAIDKEFAKEVALKEIGVRKAYKQQLLTTKKYHEVFTSINSQKWNQKTLQKWWTERAEIIDDFVTKEVPKEMKDNFMKLRGAYDEFMLKASEGDDPLLKGVNPIFSPREVQKKFLSEVFGDKLPQYISGKGGHLKERKFTYTTEYEDWVRSNGGKVEEDAGILFVNYMRNMELKLARHNTEKALVARLGYENKTQLPGVLKDKIDWLYNGGSKGRDSAFGEALGQMYGKALNASKVALTSINPAFNGRNLLSQPLLAMTGIGFKALNPMNWTDAFLMKAGRKGNLVTKTGEKIPYDKFLDFAEQNGYLMSSRFHGDITRSTKETLGRYKWTKDPMKKFVAESLNFNGTVDDMGRLAVASTLVKEGKPLAEAFELSRKAMVDYNLLNSPADKTMQGIFGFYTFTRRNVERQVVNLMNDPKQYAITARALDKISNREKLSEEELTLLNNYDRGTFKMFGDVVDGVREYTTLGFFPAEDAYRTLNSAGSGEFRKMLGANLNPVLSSFLDWYYSKDSFTGQDFGNALAPKYTNLIPKEVQKALNLTERERPKWKGGEIVGKEKVLYGDPDTISLIRDFPITSRFLGDAATLIEKINEGKTKQGLTKYTLGIGTRELDVGGRKAQLAKKQREALRKAAKAKGATTMQPMVYVPKEEKKESKKEAIRKKVRQQMESRQ